MGQESESPDESEGPQIPRGKDLEAVIERLTGHGLISKRQLSELAMTDWPTLKNWINNLAVKRTVEKRVQFKSVMNKACRCCGQYTENKEAWEKPDARRDSKTSRG